MKLAEAVAKFIEAQGVRHVFGVNGGANLHLIHGIYEKTDIQFIPTTHEQNAAFAADAYARIRGLGVAMATSGPGATNLITGIATSFYDSIPVIYITGNVASHRFGSRFGVRQYGFQETPIVDMVKPITKFSRMIHNPDELIPVLQMAVREALNGRKGPVLIDIPDDVQRMDVPDPVFNDIFHLNQFTPSASELQIETLKALINEAKRPVFIWGAGMRPYAKEARALAEWLDIPVACTWGAVDLLPHDHALMCGGFGTHGVRAANLMVQNADLVISLGSRLDTKATGTPQHWVREGRVVMVDIDTAEILKMKQVGRQVDLAIYASAKHVIERLQEMPIGDTEEWSTRVAELKERYASKYPVIDEIAQKTGNLDIIVTDTGTGVGMVCQAFPFSGKQRLIHAWNMTPMGYAIPAAIGAALASGKNVTCIMGDGGAMMSLPELATARRWNLPIAWHLLDNGGHAMCRQTERQWFGGRYCSTDERSGLGFPDWPTAFAAFGLTPYFYHHHLPFSSTLVPQAKYGQPIEDADPQLPWDEFKEQMIVKPMERT